MKSAYTAPNFRLWTPTGEAFPAVGANAVGFGKAMSDVDAKWYNKDTWRVESFLKRNKENCMWIDPSASKSAKGGSVSATFGYDDFQRGVQYRGTTDDSLKHTSEVSYKMPLMDGEQRVKVSMSTSLDKETFLPKTDDVTTKVFWKAMLPKFTTEAIVKQTKNGLESVNAWIQGEVTNDLAYGGMVSYSTVKKALSLWEVGLLHTLRTGEGVVAARAFVRDGEHFELGLLPPAMTVANKKVQLYLKANHHASSGKTDTAVASEVKCCPAMDLKARVSTNIGLQDVATSFAAIWSAPGGWRVAASIANPFAKDMKFGVRFAQGSTPPPL